MTTTTTTQPTTYNGWKNYETWAVKLWIDNEQATQEQWQDAAADQMRRARMYPSFAITVSEDARIALAEILKNEITDAAPDLGATMWADLLNAALSEVDWFEIANALLEGEDGYEAQP